jgi:hypothetical protein
MLCLRKRHEMLRRALGVIVIGLLITFASVKEASADRIHELTRTLIHSKHDKARIAAAVSLGRLKDRRAIKPLLAALKDPNRVVRAVAATALGKLGDPVALPRLQRAIRDRDNMVRKRAVEAIALIQNRERAARAPAKKPKSKRAGFGNQPRSLGPRPTLFLALKSATDDSVGKRTKGNKKLREQRAARMRKLLESEFKATTDVTTNLNKASSFGLERSSIDASITRLDRRVRGPYIEIECEIRLAISDDRGKMLSFLTGGAKVQIPKRTFRKKYLRQIQLEAIENAVKSVHQDLISHLRRHPNRS